MPIHDKPASQWAGRQDVLEQAGEEAVAECNADIDGDVEQVPTLVQGV